MTDELTAAVGALTAIMLPAATAVARNWPAWERKPMPKPAVRSVYVSLDELLGPPSPYTHDFEHAPGVVRQEFRDCPHCRLTTAGVRTDDGWWCGECLTPARTEAVA